MGVLQKHLKVLHLLLRHRKTNQKRQFWAEKRKEYSLKVTEVCFTSRENIQTKSKRVLLSES